MDFAIAAEMEQWFEMKAGQGWRMERRHEQGCSKGEEQESELVKKKETKKSRGKLALVLILKLNASRTNVTPFRMRPHHESLLGKTEASCSVSRMLRSEGQGLDIWAV